MTLEEEWLASIMAKTTREHHARGLDTSRNSLVRPILWLFLRLGKQKGTFKPGNTVLWMTSREERTERKLSQINCARIALLNAKIKKCLQRFWVFWCCVPSYSSNRWTTLLRQFWRFQAIKMLFCFFLNASTVTDPNVRERNSDQMAVARKMSFGMLSRKQNRNHRPVIAVGTLITNQNSFHA